MNDEKERLQGNLGMFTYQRGVDCVLWVKLKAYLADVMYYQGRREDLYILIDGAKEDCNKLKDNVFERTLLGIKARAKVNEGKKEEGLIIFEKAEQIGRRYFHNDNSYGRLLADLGELYYYSKEWKSALDLFKQSKQIFLHNVHRFLFDFNFHNINSINNPLKVCAD